MSFPWLLEAKNTSSGSKSKHSKKDSSAAFFNEAAPKALKPVTKKVEENENVQTSETKTKTEEKKSLWSSNEPDDDDDEDNE